MAFRNFQFFIGCKPLHVPSTLIFKLIIILLNCPSFEFFSASRATIIDNTKATTTLVLVRVSATNFRK